MSDMPTSDKFTNENQSDKSFNDKDKSINENQFKRRDLIKLGAILGGGAIFAGAINQLFAQTEKHKSAILPEANPHKPEDIIYSVCLQCNTGCPIKVRLEDGVASKIDGNPYAPWSFYPHLDYKTPLEQVAGVEGGICPKGQAGLQIVYDPYRVKKVLKRAGKRGENKWVTISFEDAIKEIVEGGKLFSHVPGEENRQVAGLKDIHVLKKSKVAKEMEKDVKAIWKKKMTVEEFKVKHKDYLDELIDPDHPDFGPKNNQLVWVSGRLKPGRSEFFKRFIESSFGSVNFHGHTTVCQGSLYFTGYAMSNQFDFDEKEKHLKWTGGKKFYWQADLSGAEFVLFVGSNPFEANYGPPYRTNKVTDGVANGKLKFAVCDPRLPKTPGKAWKWLPIKPGTEGSLAMALIRYVLEHDSYNADYLKCANKGSAKAQDEPNWTNAVWLVKIEDGHPGEFLRGSDIGLPKRKIKAVSKDGEEMEDELDPFVTLVKGKPVTLDPNNEDEKVYGDLFVNTTLNGISVKSALQLLKEEAYKHTVEEWTKICGLNPRDVLELASEFVSHGRKSVVDIHRGVSQHTNGFYQVLSFYTLQLLIGNFDYRGGLVAASTYNIEGDKAKDAPYNFKKEMHPHKAKAFGISIIRHGVDYEKTTIFNGYPAKRPWYPLCSDVYQEVVPSSAQGYPYPVKALIMYMAAPTYSLPGGHTQIQALLDPAKIPLAIAIDITVGETSMYADYIIPDLSYLERWEFQGSHPSIIWKVQPVRQPVIAPLTETVKVFGSEMPICAESFFLALSEKMVLNGWGKDGFGPGMDFTRPEDFYLKMAANIAYGEKDEGKGSVPDADSMEMEVFLKARRHLPKTVFDANQWKNSAGEKWWAKVVYLLNRGGRFEDFPKAFDGSLVKHKYGKQINMYIEKTAKTKNSMTGKKFPGLATYIEIADSIGKPISKEGFDLHLITYREVTQTKSRTIASPWLTALLPENFLLISSTDAKSFNLHNGDNVRLISSSNPEGVWDLGNGRVKPMDGIIKVMEGIRPGVIAFCLGYGHWSYGSSSIVIDGKTIKPDERRGKGIHGNAAMLLDPNLKDVCLSDLAGGSAVFYDTPVTLKKI